MVIAELVHLAAAGVAAKAAVATGWPVMSRVGVGS